MKLVGVFIIALTGLLGTANGAPAQDTLHADMTGFREVPANSTVARGQFKGEIMNDTTIAYELTYSGLEGTVTQGHIHFGQRFTTGGISLWLCQTATNADPTGLAPTCPQEASGDSTVKGSLTAANLVGPAGQGIDGTPETRTAEEFAEILKAIRAGLTYANVHSSKFPPGEVRGQIRVKKDRKDRDDKDDDKDDKDDKDRRR